MSKYLDNEADIAFQAAGCAEVTFKSQPCDLGGTGVNISLRNAINKGIKRPLEFLLLEKQYLPTGGHADPTNGSNRN
jgi:hypothetical protein